MRDLILPPLRRTARDAEAFARVVHADQVDKAGRPYVEHLERVARAAFRSAMMNHGFDFRGQEIDELAQIARLHDVIEDGKATDVDLVREGFCNNVVMAVDVWLNRRRNKPYAEYIGDICARAPLPALLVKVADTEDNADPERLAAVGPNNLAKRYAASLPILRAAVDARGERT